MFFYSFFLQTFALICLLSVLATVANAQVGMQTVAQQKASVYEIQKKHYFFAESPFFYTDSTYPLAERIFRGKELDETEFNFDDEEFSLRQTCDVPTKRRFCETLTNTFRQEKDRAFFSLGSFYRRETALNYGLALGLGAVLANTSCDENFARWYQTRAYQHETGDLVRVTKIIGNGYYAIPAVLLASYAYRFWEENHDISNEYVRFFGEVSSRSAQAIFVGFPVLLLGQRITGPSRPGENSWGSDWKFWSDDNGISGHTFLGAIPFVTAAQLSRSPGWKTVFYVCSLVVGMGRIHDNDHYLSQVILGWYLAYLTCRAVQQVDQPDMSRGLTVFPVFQRDSIGLGVELRW